MNPHRYPDAERLIASTSSVKRGFIIAPDKPSTCYHLRGMIVLFSIAMVCFFSLFGMIVILLRQAKAEGTLARSERNSILKKGRNTADETTASRSRIVSSQIGPYPGLSNLVPSKQADWRFMVRGSDPEQQSSQENRNSLRPFRYDLNRTDRTFSHRDHGDLRDPQSSKLARRA